MKSKFCGDRRPHSSHPWQRQRQRLMCAGSVMDVDMKTVRRILSEPKDTSCLRGLDDLHEEYYQLTESLREDAWKTNFNRYTSLGYQSSYTQSGYTYYMPSWFSNNVFNQPPEPVTKPQTREASLESQLHECWYYTPRCRWQHDDSNDDV